MGIDTKRNLDTLRGVTVPDVASKKRRLDRTVIRLWNINLVFLDESGINIDLTRLYRTCYSKELRCGR